MVAPALRRSLGAPARIAAAALLCGAVQLPADPANAVIGGAPDGSAHPYVAMLHRPGSTRADCSGVLVRQGSGGAVVLTTAHCFSGTGRRSGTGFSVTFDATFTSSSPRYAGTFYVDPRFRYAGDAHDLAVLVLRSRPPAAPARLAAVGHLDRARPTSLTTVGGGEPHRGQRRSATERTTGRSASWQFLRAGDGNSCDFDSGGPDLMPGSTTVVALTDQGSCQQDQDLRVDTGEAHHFVDDPRRWH